MDKTIAVIKKNGVEEVRVVLSEYRGHDLVSVRIWANYDSADSEKRPNKKGVAFSTLADWVGQSTALLEPLADAIGRHVLRGQALFADDTPVKMLVPGSGKTKTARLWAYVRDERPWVGDAPTAGLVRRTCGAANSW